VKTDLCPDYTSGSASLEEEMEFWRAIYQRRLKWSRPSEALLSGILRFSLFAERVRELFCVRRGLGVNELWTLYTLRINERCPKQDREIFSPGTLVELLQMAPGCNPSEVVGRLYGKKYIRLQEDPSLGDRRKRVLSLTRAGRNAARVLEEEFLGLADDLLGNIGKEDLGGFLRMLRLILGRVKLQYEIRRDQAPAGRRSPRKRDTTGVAAGTRRRRRIAG